jgi:hypothetical protein
MDTRKMSPDSEFVERMMQLVYRTLCFCSILIQELDLRNLQTSN